MNINNIYAGIIISLLLVFMFIMTVAWLEDLKEMNDIYKMAHMYADNYKTQNNMPGSQYKKFIKSTTEDIVKYNEKKSLLNTLLNSCYNGIIQGGIVGMITGGPIESVTNGLVYGLSNPIVLFIQKQYMYSEKLSL